MARELTKLHEEWFDGAGTVPERGEFVIIFGQTTNTALLSQAPTEADAVILFGQITERGEFTTRREAVKAVAEHLGLPVRAVYNALERAKKQPA